jgi:hypothetical protein
VSWEWLALADLFDQQSAIWSDKDADNVLLYPRPADKAVPMAGTARTQEQARIRAVLASRGHKTAKEE